MSNWNRIQTDKIGAEQGQIVGPGKTVKVHYVGKLEDGVVFDSSMDRAPLELTIGQSNTIPGFIKGIMGMHVGEKKTFSMPASEGYGEKREDLIIVVTRDEFPDNIVPDIGQVLQIKQQNGSTVNVVVADIEDNDITLDANHPLAGENLTFEVEIIEIK